MTVLDFKPWPKTPRLMKDMIITEKIDGTNGCVVIKYDPPPAVLNPNRVAIVGDYIVYAQSRNRFITPEKDSYEFAAWVRDNAVGLVATLGEGHHYGEWYGQKIARSYGLQGRRFALFNVNRYQHVNDPTSELVFGLETVPVLHVGPFNTTVVNQVYWELAENGSHAVPGFMRPEGLIVYHTASGQVYKYLGPSDEHKWQQRQLKAVA